MHRSCAELIRYRKDLARPAPFECVCALIWQARCQKTHSMARDLRLSDTWRGGEESLGENPATAEVGPSPRDGRGSALETGIDANASWRKEPSGGASGHGKGASFLVAHSGGGRVFLMYIARNPEAREMVRALVTLG